MQSVCLHGTEAHLHAGTSRPRSRPADRPSTASKLSRLRRLPRWKHGDCSTLSRPQKRQRGRDLRCTCRRLQPSSVRLYRGHCDPAQAAAALAAWERGEARDSAARRVRTFDWVPSVRSDLTKIPKLISKSTLKSGRDRATRGRFALKNKPKNFLDTARDRAALPIVCAGIGGAVFLWRMRVTIRAELAQRPVYPAMGAGCRSADRRNWTLATFTSFR
jgi:hypothetical protein